MTRTTMSLSVSTVRSAVLKGLASGREMRPVCISSIFKGFAPPENEVSLSGKFKMIKTSVSRFALNVKSNGRTFL